MSFPRMHPVTGLSLRVRGRWRASKLVRHCNVFPPSPKPANIEHAAENAGVGNLRLSGEDIARIDKAFPLAGPPGGLPML